MHKCSEKTEVYSRIVGYFRPVQQWNVGKKEEYSGRRTFDVAAADSFIPEAVVEDDAAVFNQRVSGNVAH